MLKRFFSGLTLVALLLSLISTQVAEAEERKKATWGASCPAINDATPEKEMPSTQNLIFSGTGQDFRRLQDNGLERVQSSQPVIGCYVNEQLIVGNLNSPAWQIGALNRDANGFYFINAAGIKWRLTLNDAKTAFETEPGSLYFDTGNLFKLSKQVATPANCKAEDYFLGSLRIGFPRNPKRVPAKGTTNNVIVVVDFFDAPLNDDYLKVVENVLSPQLTQNYFEVSSNRSLSPKFTVFPKLIRMESSEKSFAPNAQGTFMVNGVMQDHRLAKEAIALAEKYGPLDTYSSISIFAPTGKSLGYYGSAYPDFHVYTGRKYVENVLLVGGTIGTVTSSPPSWEVFAHEYGHLLGMYDYYISGDGNTGKSPGPFDFMGNTSGTAFTTLSYQRWVQGWLNDSDVYCDSGSDAATTFSLKPLNSLSGKRSYVKALSGTEMLVAEYRAEGTFESLNGQDGILVYVLNTSIGSGQGPISIKPSEQDIPIKYANDVERYSRATLTVGQSVTIDGSVLYAKSITKESAELVVIPKSKFIEYTEALKAAPISTPSPTPTSQVSTPTKIVGKIVATKCRKGKVIKTFLRTFGACPSGWKKA